MVVKDYMLNLFKIWIKKKKVNIISYIIKRLKSLKDLKKIVLAISAKKENLEFVNIAKKNSISYVLGDDHDVLSRLIKASTKNNATDILRITSESPFPYLENFANYWSKHVENNYDATFLDNIIDGCGFEIIKTSALKISHRKGKKKHRSEFCSLYIRENNKKFRINRIFPKKMYFRKDIRLTVDNPEDLIVCQAVYNHFKNKKIVLKRIINFIDKRPYLKSLIKPYCANGYNSMYNWIK